MDEKDENIMGRAIRRAAEFSVQAAKAAEVEAIEALLQGIMGAKRVFVYGHGGDGLVARSFAGMLVHLDVAAYVADEITTPRMRKDDLLICISGSGENLSTIECAKSAKREGARIAAITMYPQSALGIISDLVIRIKAKMDSMESPGALFHIAAGIFFHGLLAELRQRLGKSDVMILCRRKVTE